MTVEVEDLLKHSVVISVDDSIYHRFIYLFEQQNLKPIPRLYRGMKLFNVGEYWTTNQPMQNFGQTQCIYSHISLVKMAKFLDWPYICIFEDDAYPCRDCKKHLEDVIQNIPDDIHCLILGYNNLQFHKCNDHDMISHCDELWGSHAFVLFKSGYDEYIAVTEKEPCVADRILYRLNNVYAINHNLFIQYNTMPSIISKCQGYTWHNHDENDILKQFPRIEEYDFLENTVVNKQCSMCVVFQCHVINDESIRRAQFIYDACQKMDYCFIWALDRKHMVENSSSIPNYMAKVYLQPYNTLDYNVELMSKNTFSVAYNVLKYNSHFKYIWSIEYDVCYSGDWTDFFKRFENDDSDMLLPDIVNYEDYHKTWHWWQYINKEDLNDKWWRSRSQIFRLSRHAIESVKTFLDSSKQYYLISEIFLATAGHVHGLRMTDIANACDKSFDCYSKNIYDIKENDKLQHAIKLDVKWPDFSKEYFVKICIPSHNVEKTFRKTLDSIMSQTFKDFAVVICDDKSSDKTYQIAQEYASKYENVFVCQTKDGNNASIARNTTLKYPVKAKYTWFIDSDDWLVDDNAFKLIYDKTENSDVDLLYHGVDDIYTTCCNAPFFKIAKTSLMPEFNEELSQGINDMDQHVRLLNNVDPEKVALVTNAELYHFNGSHHDYSKLDEQYLNKIIDSIKSIEYKNDKVRRAARLKINSIINQHILPLRMKHEHH